MNRSLITYAAMSVVAVIAGVLENTFFGADHGGAKHDISVAFFFLAVAGLLALLGIAVVAIIQYMRRSRAAS